MHVRKWIFFQFKYLETKTNYSKFLFSYKLRLRMNIIICCMSKYLSKYLLISCDWLRRVILMKVSNKRSSFCLISVTLMKAFWSFYHVIPNAAILPAESRLDCTLNRSVGEVAVQTRRLSALNCYCKGSCDHINPYPTNVENRVSS